MTLSPSLSLSSSVWLMRRRGGGGGSGSGREKGLGWLVGGFCASEVEAERATPTVEEERLAAKQTTILPGYG